jgi:hypothetical protein
MERSKRTIADLFREAEQIALDGKETKEHAFGRLLEAHPEAYESFRAKQNAQNTSKTVCRVAGIEERTLRDWLLRGLLKIETSDMPGAPDSRKWRRYTFGDMITIAVIKRLTETGFSASHAADCVNSNRHYWENDPFGRFYLVVRHNDNGAYGYQGTKDPSGLESILHPAGAPDLSTWLPYSNQQYGVALRYPPTYTIVQLTNPLQPAPIFRVGFQLASLTNPAGPEPPLFEIDVYDNASQQALDAWLASNVVSRGTATNTAVQVGGQSGIEVAYQVLLAPDTFYYVARGSFVYQFTPLGTYSDTMLSTVQFTQ